MSDLHTPIRVLPAAPLIDIIVLVEDSQGVSGMLELQLLQDLLLRLLDGSIRRREGARCKQMETRMHAFRKLDTIFGSTEVAENLGMAHKIIVIVFQGLGGLRREEQEHARV